ncbi:hypothetical protein HY414_01655 [Candidatus Kaiserbacteria bacterium]|nr:hypothetical protein [Candidatus Kaiserbacteria bacterium]
MSARFWTTILAFNSVLWFTALGFLAYSFGTLITSLDWRLFLLALATFVAVSLTEIVLTALGH